MQLLAVANEEQLQIQLLYYTVLLVK